MVISGSSRDLCCRGRANALGLDQGRTSRPQNLHSPVASQPGVAYNQMNNECLVAWVGDHAGFAGDDWDIVILRVDATTGAELGSNAERISSMGPVARWDVHELIAIVPLELSRY